MKTITFSFKSLLVACGLLIGSANAWGAPTGSNVLSTMTGIVGPTDNSSSAFTYGSKVITIAAGETYEMTFVNYNAGSGKKWYNWILEGNNGSQYFDFRPDGGYWGAIFEGASPAAIANYTGSTHTTISGVATDDDDTWLTAYNGVTVTLTATRSNDGATLTFTHSATTNTSVEYSGTFTITLTDASSTINFYITNEKSHQKITKVVKNGTELNYASSESAYVDQTAGNTTTNYNGASLDKLYIRNTQYRDWGTSDGTANFRGNGKLSLYKFDLTPIKNKLSTEGGTITGVTFSVYGKSSETGKSVTNVRIVGYNPAWNSSTVTYSNLTNNVGTILGTVSDGGSFQPLNDVTGRSITDAGTTLTENALTYVNSAIAANNDYVTIAVMANLGRDAWMNTVATLTFTYSAAVLYEATFTENNSLNPTVTVYSDNEKTVEVAKNELEANTTYYYKAVLAGYEDYEGSFDVVTSNPAVNFTMTSLPRYTFTVNAVNSVGGAVIETLFTDADSYNGKTYTVYYPAYLTSTGNVVTYSKDNSTYSQNFTSATGDATKTVSYTAYTGNAWFYEGEDITGATTYTTATFAGRSSNGATGVLSEKNIANLAAGSYKISARVIGRADNTMSMYKTSKSGEKIFDVKTSTTGAVGVGYITLDAATDIVADGGYYTTSDNGWGFDYILIEEVTSIPATIGATGYTTFASPYALDLTNLPSGVTAYYASAVDAEKVTLTEKSNEAVAAGTGLVLKGAAGTYNIPVAASGADISSSNKLVGQTTATTVYGADKYILYNVSGSAKFCNLTNYTDASPMTIPAGKAYLDSTIGGGGAKALNIVFDGTATGIEAATVAEASEEEGVLYNTAGQVVSKDYKGIVIKNGKKYYQK